MVKVVSRRHRERELKEIEEINRRLQELKQEEEYEDIDWILDRTARKVEPLHEPDEFGD